MGTDMAPRYRVTLTEKERSDLEAISTKGKRAARTVLYARALLLLDVGEFGQNWIVSKVAEALGATTRSLEHLKKRFVEQGLPAARQLPGSRVPRERLPARGQNLRGRLPGIDR